MPVSRETENKLECYLETLIKWNSKINLVSQKTIENAWERHFLDSAQLVKYIPENTKKVVDIGSGAGFPGVVLATLKGDFNLDFETNLVESDSRKCAFLQEVVRVCDVSKVRIFNSRIEKNKDLNGDVVTARALADLNLLLDYSYNYITKYGKYIFLKTQNIDKELHEAQKSWIFDYSLEPSITDENGAIIIVENLKKIEKG